jgi:hypothetical protein
MILALLTLYAAPSIAGTLWLASKELRFGGFGLRFWAALFGWIIAWPLVTIWLLRQAKL